MIMWTLLFNILVISLYILVCYHHIGVDNIINNHKQPEKFQNLLDFVEKCVNASILDYTLKPLTEPGDNFNSMLQALVVKSTKQNNSDIQIHHLVTKTINANSINARKSKQFLNEMHFYEDIVPTIQHLEQVANVPESERIDAFVHYFGSRLSLDANAENADSNAIMLLENVKHLRFINLKQWHYFSYDETLAVLKRLAKLHAIIIATRRLQPDVYAEKIGPHLHTTYNDSFIDTLLDISDKFADKLPTSFPNMPKCEYIAIRKSLSRCREFVKDTTRPNDTPYTTIYHRDLWSKNIMTRRGRTDHQPIEVKILDFQSYDYESFAFDLIFFLLINARVEDLTTKHFPTFIEYYHLEFVKTMELVHCPSDDYAYEKMWNEIKEKASLNLFNIYLYLAQDQIQFLKSDANSGDLGSDFYLAQPTPEIILNRLESINRIYIRNGFI